MYIKKFFYLSFIFVSVFLSSAWPNSSLLLAGTIRPSMKVQVKTVVNEFLNINTAQKDLEIASIKESTTSRSGYKVFIESSNRGKLVGDNSVSSHPYSIKYDGKTINLKNPVEITQSKKFHEIEKIVSVSYDASLSNSENNYSDIIKVTYRAD